MNGKYICRVNNGFTIQKLEKVLVDYLSIRKESFVEQYSLKIFRNLFQYARDLRQEYMKYYYEEYDNFSEFLYKKEFWDISNIENAALGDENTVLKLQIHNSSYNMDNLLDYDESISSMIIKILEDIEL